MVKKIDGPGTTQKTGSVGSTQSTEATRAAQVDKVAGAGEKSGIKGVPGHGRPMTSADREHLYQIINEEAEKLFAEQAVPKSKRKLVEGAVRTAIDASTLDEDNDTKQKS